MTWFSEQYPQWKSWLDGFAHEIPRPLYPGRFRSALRNRCQQRQLNLSTKTVNRDGTLWLQIRTR